jgi:hypothetical protein
MEPEGQPMTGMPRWVKVSLIIVAVFVALGAVFYLTGGSESHGPGRHGPSMHNDS